MGCAALVGCATSPAREPAPAPATTAEPITVAPPPEEPTEPAVVAVGNPPAKPAGFAASPLTGFANSVVALTQAALDGRGLPNTDIKLAPYDATTQLVRAERKVELPRSSELDIFLLGLEVDIQYFPLKGGPDGRPRLSALVILSREGLKVAGLRTTPATAELPLPSYLDGIDTFASQVLDAAKSGTLERLFIGEPERKLIADEKLWTQVARESEQRTEDKNRLAEFARRAGQPRGYRFDDLVLLARHRDGRIIGLKLDFDRKDGQLVLDTSPLVRVRQLVPEPSGTIEAPPPVPTP